MSSQLIGCSPLTLRIEGTSRSLPTPQLLENIPTLHDILEAIVEDWNQAIAPYQSDIDAAVQAEGSPSRLISQVFLELQPAFLKCIFSYVLFFVATDRAYSALYNSLNIANRESGLRLKHAKPPKPTDYIEKVRNIRNLSISHLGSEKVKSVDAFAAMSWTPMMLSAPIGGPWSIEELTFGGFRVQRFDAEGIFIGESADLEVKGMAELHSHCLAYLQEYDQVCVTYLRELHIALSEL